jgi:hypothetical protein
LGINQYNTKPAAMIAMPIAVSMNFSEIRKYINQQLANMNRRGVTG